MKIAQKIFESYKGSLLETSINNTNLSGLFLCRHSAQNAIRRQRKNPVKLQFLESCEAHIDKRIKSIQSKHWVKSLTNFSPEVEGHWSKYTTGFNISLSGKIWLSNNKPIKVNDKNRQGLLSPNHNNLVTGSGVDETIFSGIYYFEPDKEASLFLYSECENVLNQQMKLALLSLVDVHNITIDTAVFSNLSREKLFSLSEI